MRILEEIVGRAKAKNGKIILPETLVDERIMQALEKIVETDLTDVVVFGREENYADFVRKSKRVTIIDIDRYPQLEDMATTLYELRKHKGLTLDEARELIKKPIYFSCMMLKLNLADGIVAGAKYTTADTLRPALQIIKTEEGKNIVAGSVLLIREQAPDLLLFCDAGLNENPTSEQLVDIAIGGADFIKNVINREPKVAFLSYSTMGSAKNELVEKVQLATKLAKDKNTGYLIDGEMQFDCAIDKATALRKGVNSPVGGEANVMVFPDLNAGNISYKIASRLGGYLAIGPIMVNFKKPVNDLSRGCSVDEIVLTVAITKLQIKGN